MWPYYENRFFVQKKNWDDEDIWTTREYKMDSLSFFGNQQYLTYERTLDLPEYKYTSMYALGYELMVFTYNDYVSPKKHDIFQLYECYSDDTSCSLHYEYSILDDVVHIRDRKYAN